MAQGVPLRLGERADTLEIAWKIIIEEGGIRAASRREVDGGQAAEPTSYPLIDPEGQPAVAGGEIQAAVPARELLVRGEAHGKGGEQGGEQQLSGFRQ